jgi:ribosomal protein S18 acetylase RimI-like enzyme
MDSDLENKYKPYTTVLTENKGIIFRNYKPGDDQGLAEVFNYGFQQNGFGDLRTAKNYHWRYVDNPTYEPEQINIAEDKETGKIVGSIMGTIEPYYINCKKFIFGAINDVCTFPGYNGRGIAKNLMKMAINYFYKKKADYSSLSADPHGFPREKIYLPSGYKDVVKLYVLVHITNYKTILTHIPGMAMFLPGLSLFKIAPYITNFNYRKATKKLNYQDKKIPNNKDYTIEILHYTATQEFRQRFNEVGLRQFDCFRPFTPEEWIWMRKKCPSKGVMPSQIVIRDNTSNKIIGGSIIGHHNMYGSKLGIKIRMGGIKDVFVDESFISEKFNPKKESSNRKIVLEETKKLYKILFSAIVTASEERGHFASMMMTGSDFKNACWGAVNSGYIMFPAGTHMVRQMRSDLPYPKLKKPFYLDPGEEYGKF